MCDNNGQIAKDLTLRSVSSVVVDTADEQGKSVFIVIGQLLLKTHIYLKINKLAFHSPSLS